MKSFMDALKSGVLVCDGAMGTMLYSKGVYINQCFDELNLSAPHLIRSIHAEYLKAGAMILETNTYGANRHRLAPFGLEAKTTEINAKGVSIAKKVARNHAYVAGAVGRLKSTVLLRDMLTPDDIRAIYAEQIEALATSGVDLILIETISSFKMMSLAIEAVRQVCDLPIVAQMTVTEEGATIYGDEPEEIAEFLKDQKVEVGGLNCSVGPQQMLDAIERMAKTKDLLISAQPNAGQPKLVEGRYMYLCSPEYMAEYARRFIAKGASIVGGCCGTTPAHIAAIAAAVKSTTNGAFEVFDVQLELEQDEILKAEAEREPTRFEQAMKKGFTLSIELNPPRGVGIERVLERAAMIKEAGVDAINIADGPRASARMSPIVLGNVIEREVGIDVIVHFCCRDRNIVALQADLMAAYVAGLRNVLLITGDPPKMGDYPLSTAVFDVDSIGLSKITRNLNLGLDLAGKTISRPTEFFIGVGVNPGAIDLEEELRRFAAKKEAGAQFAMTQPVYEPGLLENFLERSKGIDIPIFVGILPLISYRNAEFLHNEVPGMAVPKEVRERMRHATSGEEAKQEGIAIASDALQLAIGMDRIVGAYLIPPLGQVDLALQVIERVDLPSRG
ncbi:MAG: bifunctional homocysteine S-methyltransferase/methylenetetrahydrofolate reductase [Candidatus Coatesbacteria bacterium]|nr:bifunctional homocysteine S-methyltransferase/methylenetetrahydrofolate reductase [Candidatus Coatesbacteria bacterium]